MSNQYQAYCVKCKTKRDIISPQAVYTQTGTPGTRGSCPECGTTLFRMGATEAHEGLPKPEVTPQRKKKPAKSKAKAKPARKQAEKKASSRRGGGKLVIVESPAKARSVGNFLGRGYTVRASKGHVRDLLVTQLSVDVDNNFEPKYRVPNDKRDVTKELKSLADRASEIYLATDPDREGEAIAWHLIAATDMDESRVKRVVFHEITEPAVAEAFGHPRSIDMNLVNAQQARRILDRLVGYNITELLWQKVRNQLSAGRVQSIAVRLIVDREREIQAFTPEEYWTLDASLKKHAANNKDNNRPFIARLVKIGDTDVAFGAESELHPHLEILKKSRYTVSNVKHGTRQRKPSAPFTTSTLQQEASRRLGFSASRTMTLAQQLYEGIDTGNGGPVGLITYMRTDSTQVAKQAQAEAREFIHQRFGEKYHPARPPRYATRTKGAQEAHEAIRPTSVLREPQKLAGHLNAQQMKLYTLIWQRFVASQMANAVYNTLRVDIAAGPGANEMPYTFRVSGSTIKFPGFLALYEDSRDEDATVDEDEGRILPELASGEMLDLLKLLPEQHFTQPPPRYTEASLVRTLEEYGIGRPSTYAPTVATIQDREYIEKQDKRLFPTETGKIVNDLLVQYFPDVLDYQFTARMEDELDTVAEGNLEWRPMLQEFYTPFEQRLANARENMPQIQQEEAIGRDCPESGHPLVIRYGRFGKFIGCSNYPECRYTEPWLERMGIACPTCGKTHGGELVIRKTRKGRTFYGCTRYPECDYTSWKRPLPQPCPNCGGLLVENNKHMAQCTNCGHTYRINELPELNSEPV
ncbi:MAG: type I DNA topoisomerase [Anaerolineaceae bacterium]|nr:type I DNA topoisomerase [Anaerolineaceae bacterium]